MFWGGLLHSSANRNSILFSVFLTAGGCRFPAPLYLIHIFFPFWDISFNQNLSSLHLFCFWGSSFWHLRSLIINFKTGFPFLPGDLGLHCRYVCLTHLWPISHITYLWLLIPPSMPRIHILRGVQWEFYFFWRDCSLPTGAWPHLLVLQDNYTIEGPLSVFSRLFSLHPEIITMTQNYWDISMCQACVKLSRYLFQSSQQPYRVTISIPPI